MNCAGAALGLLLRGSPGAAMIGRRGASTLRTVPRCQERLGRDKARAAARLRFLPPVPLQCFGELFRHSSRRAACLGLETLLSVGRTRTLILPLRSSSYALAFLLLAAPGTLGLQHG